MPESQRFFLSSILTVCFFFSGAGIANSTTLDDGIAAFQRENNDEAAVLLEKARKEDPASTRAAYYLGMTYKKLQRYEEAKKHLNDAVMLTPKVKEALLELVDVDFQLGDTAHAKELIAVAEQEQIRPAQTAFMKGQVLMKEGRSEEAIQAFADAKTLDKSLAQAADYQIGILHLKDKSFDLAQKAFQEVLALDPNSDISAYTKEYMKALERRGEGAKPFYLNAAFYEEYDDNVILKPGDVTTVQDIGNAADWREVATVDTAYAHKFDDYWGLRFQYNLYYANQHELDSFDLHSHTGSAIPSYNISKDAVASVPLQYNYTWVHGDGFLGTFTANPLLNYRVFNNQLLQLGVKLQDKNYITEPTIGDEDRDAFRVAPGVGWFWFFWENKGIFGARYEFDYENTDGRNWEYLGNRVNVSLQTPLVDKLKLTLAGDFYFQDFQNTHTIFNVKRQDDAYTLSAQLAYPIWNQVELQFRYTYVKHDSNIAIYDYDRNIYSTGVMVKF